MRINSVSRSDIFNEYVKIISNFNEKRSITKGASAGDVIADVGRLGSNILGEITPSEVNAALDIARATSQSLPTINLLRERNLIQFIDGLESVGKADASPEEIIKAIEIFNGKVVQRGSEFKIIAPDKIQSGWTNVAKSNLEKATRLKQEYLKNIGIDYNKVKKFSEDISKQGDKFNIEPYLKEDVKTALKAADTATPIEPAAQATAPAVAAPKAPDQAAPAAPKAPDQAPAAAPKAPDQAPAAAAPKAPAVLFDRQKFLDNLTGFNKLSDVSKNAITRMVLSNPTINTADQAFGLINNLYITKLTSNATEDSLGASIKEIEDLGFKDKIIESLNSRIQSTSGLTSGLTSKRLNFLKEKGLINEDVFNSKIQDIFNSEYKSISDFLTSISADQKTFEESLKFKNTAINPEEVKTHLGDYDTIVKSEAQGASKSPMTPAPQPKPVAVQAAISPQQVTQAVGGISEDEATKLIKQLLSESNALHNQSIEAVRRSLEGLSENNKNLLSDINKLTEQLKALKSATPEQTESIFSRVKSFLENLRGNKSPANEAAIKEAEALLKRLEDQTKTIKETEKSLKDSLKALSDAKAASTAPEKSKFIDFAKAGFVSGLLKLSAVGLLSIGVYNMVTADDSEESDVNAGASIYPSGEESGKVEDIFNDTSKQGLKSDPFATPESRANFSEKLKNMSPDRREEVLSEVARRRGAVGSHTLSRPIRIGGERIETVFPSQAAASRSPLTPGRLQATEEYMYKLLENNGRKASNIKGRILADANSNDPQDIADYMFSTIANKGLFKGLGTMRAGRYGRGGAIDADSNKGFSGSRKERMTMKERRSLRDVAREEFDQNEEPSDQIMDSFASGYEEIMKKYSSDSEYSINNSEIMKKADKISKRYFKDAVKDLASDGFMSEYYAGFSKLYDSKVKKRKPDFKTLYGFQEETGADRIHEAHPEAIVVSDAIGRGGLVENASEASKAMQEVALSMPTGNYRARYAFIQNALKKASS